jgi:hypothetical protein
VKGGFENFPLVLKVTKCFHERQLTPEEIAAGEQGIFWMAIDLIDHIRNLSF